MPEVNPDFAHSIYRLRQKYLALHKDGKSKAWISKDRLISGAGSSIYVILATRGCRWALSEYGGCSICGYIYDAKLKEVSASSLVSQFKNAMQKFSNLIPPLGIKIFTSGSFLDDLEVPLEARKKILQLISKNDLISEVTFETRPEFVKHDKIRECVEILEGKYFEVAIGLESSNDRILRDCINKGFTFNDFKKATKIVQKEGANVKVYIFVKPPFLSEKEAIKDCISSAIDVSKVGINTISFNPCTIHKGTLIEKLWKDGFYRPPWLWSLQYILQETFEKAKNQVSRIICQPVAGGKKRGAHNCGKCDKQVLRAIQQVSLLQNLESFDHLDCECRYLFHQLLSHQSLS